MLCIMPILRMLQNLHRTEQVCVKRIRTRMIALNFVLAAIYAQKHDTFYLQRMRPSYTLQVQLMTQA